jgi:hypothetical protein
VSNSIVLHGQATSATSGASASGVSALWEYAALAGFVLSAALAVGWVYSTRRRGPERDSSPRSK